jgi:ribonuclease HIII
MLHTQKLSPEEAEKLKTWCQERGWQPYAVNFAAFAFKGDGVNVVFYESGKLVVQGKKTQDFVLYTLEGSLTPKAALGYDDVLHPEWFEPHAGLDESGKGDFFGPLVSACVVADGEAVRQWQRLGIKDSKRIGSDAAVLKLAGIVRSTPGVVVKTAFASMTRYNELYPRFGHNLNLYLAWLHARSLRSALELRQVPWVMLDQFSKLPLVQNYFRDSALNIRMQPRAEADPVVAAASIVARAVYVEQMNVLSQKCGVTLPKGASQAVKQTACALVRQLGPEILNQYAKTHFKTTQEVIDACKPL